MRSKLPKWLLLFFVIALVILFNSKSIENTKEDNAYIDAFAKEWKLESPNDGVHASFETELKFLTQMEECVVATIRQVEIPHQYFGNMKYYFTNREGFCYDRAAIMEKFLLRYGFSFRHAYLFFDTSEQKQPSVLNFFKKGTNSHALVEVKTKKGWMALGTNANWIGYSNNDEVLSIGEIRKQISNNTLALKHGITVGKCFWEMKGDRFRYVYGIYSRHGDFFNSTTKKTSLLPTFHLLPDYNVRMLFYNF